MRHLAILIYVISLALCTSTPADDTDVPADLPADDSTQDSPGALAEEDTSDAAEVDEEGSIEDAVGREGWIIDGDFRGGYLYNDLESREGNEFDDHEGVLRARVGASWGITEYMRSTVRLAGSCSTSECDPEFVLESTIPATNGLARGQFTFDEIFLHWFRRERFDVAIGRLQTKFVSRGGVFSKSLDRNNSNAVNINWTDGIHGTYRARNGWVSHGIVQWNSADGTGSIRRGSLEFHDENARRTYFLALENLAPWKAVVQRTIDVSYLPNSLLKDGVPEGRVDDYWGIVGRLASRWPQRSSGRRLRISSEVGYAPETQTERASDLGASGDADGLAWNFTASVLDFLHNHSIGVNYGRTGAGWLLSPQYDPNEELLEFRYRWRPTAGFNVESRIRWRKDIERLISAERKRDDFDYFVRFTWAFSTGRG